MNVTQVTLAVTAYYFGGLRWLVIALWVNVLVVAVSEAVAKRRRRVDLRSAADSLRAQQGGWT